MNKLGVKDDILFEFLGYYFLNVLGLSMDSLHPKREGIFRRYVAKDVENIRHKTFASFQKLEFDLNREGLYDALPESMFHFHSSFKDVSYQTTSNFKNQLNLLSEEERYARSFFSVFESELSKLKVGSRYLEESSISYDFGIILQHILELIPIDLKLFQRNEGLKILTLLPELHTLFSDEGMKGIARVIKYVFNLTSEVRERQNSKWLKAYSSANYLGKQFLGMDSTLGDWGELYQWNLIIDIQLSKNQKEEFESDVIDKKIELFLSLFVPFYYTILINKNLEGGEFVIGTLEYNHRLNHMQL